MSRVVELPWLAPACPHFAVLGAGCSRLALGRLARPLHRRRGFSQAPSPFRGL